MEDGQSNIETYCLKIDPFTGEITGKVFSRRINGPTIPAKEVVMRRTEKAVSC